MKRDEFCSLLILPLAVLFTLAGAAFDFVTLASEQYQSVLLISAGFIAVALIAATVGFFSTRSIVVRATHVLLAVACMVLLGDVLRRLTS